MQGKFEPWKKGRKTGLKLAVLGLISAMAAAAFAVSGYQLAAIGFAVATVVLAKVGMDIFRRAANRKFGKEFEEDAIWRASHELIDHGFTPKPNVMVRGVGDIDLIVYRDGKRVPVEIKSFRKWNQFLVFNGEREKRALIQADRQRRAIQSSCGIVWLPQGKPTLLQILFGVGNRNVIVVFGNERKLLSALEDVLC